MGLVCRQYMDVLVMDFVGSCTQMDVLLCFGIFTALLAALCRFICMLGQFALFNSDMLRGWLDSFSLVAPLHGVYR